MHELNIVDDFKVSYRSGYLVSNSCTDSGSSLNGNVGVLNFILWLLHFFPCQLFSAYCHLFLCLILFLLFQCASVGNLCNCFSVFIVILNLTCYLLSLD